MVKPGIPWRRAGHVLCALIAPLPCLVAAPRVATAAEITFEAALDQARRSSETLRRLRLAETGAASAARAVDADSMPRLTASAAATGQKPLADAADGRDGTSRQMAAGLGLAATLVDFGRQAAREKQAALAARVSQAAAVEASEAFVWTVARAYAELVTAQRTARLASGQRRIAAARLAEQAEQYRRGLRPETDFITARVDDGKAAISLRRAEDALRTASLRLRSLIGAPDPGPDLLTAPPRLMTPASPADLLAQVSRWQRGVRPGQQQQEFKVAAIAAGQERVRSERWPTLEGSIGVRESGDPSPLRPEATAELKLSWQIPWSGRFREELASLEAERGQIELLRAGADRELADRERLARSNLDSVAGLWTMAREQLDLAKKQRQLTWNRYQSGRASALDLSTADAQESAMELELLRLAHEAQNAAIELAEALSVKDLTGLF